MTESAEAEASQAAIAALTGSTAVCVAGMHRSGTSLVARVLNACGVYLGPEDALMQAGDFNAEGHWEHVGFVQLNDEILALLGGAWDHPPVGEPDWCKRSDLDGVRTRAGALLSELQHPGYWGWKDPRTSLTLPFWRSLQPDLTSVIAIRHPLEVASSLNRRNNFSTPLSLALWSAYTRSVLDATSPDERVVTHFASYFHDPVTEAQRIAAVLGIPMHADVLSRVVAVVSPWARHHAAGSDDATLPPDVRELYETVCSEAGPVYRAARSPAKRSPASDRTTVPTTMPSDGSPDGARPTAAPRYPPEGVHRYTAFDNSAGSTHVLVSELVPRGARVLEFGCATGYMSKVLTETKGCTVTGIEIDGDAAANAMPICERVIVGDADGLDYDELLGGEEFDAVVFADVLEHLRDPANVLARVRPFLAPGGVVVASIPNVAHASVRLSLLSGRFDYRETGLLDSTHLRFFTRETIRDLFESTGYTISHWSRQRLDVDKTEISVPAEVSPDLLEQLHGDDEATTYQFIVRAERSDATSDLLATRRLLQLTRTELEELRPLARRGYDLGAANEELERLRPLAGVAEELAQLRQAHEALARRMLVERAALAAHIEETDEFAAARERELKALHEENEWRRGVLERLEEEIEWRRGVMERSENQARELDGEIHELQRQIDELESQLGRLRSSRSFRYTAPFRRVARALRPR